MKAPTHPPLSKVTVQGILHALADPVRARIYMGLAAAECPQMCSAFMHDDSGTLPKSTLSVHFKVLRDAGLIRSVRKGTQMHNTTRCAELKTKFGDLVGEILFAYSSQGGKTKPKVKKKPR